jgi:hypothetical protein
MLPTVRNGVNRPEVAVSRVIPGRAELKGHAWNVCRWPTLDGGSLARLTPAKLELAGRLCEESEEFARERRKHAFPILRIFSGFRMPRLPM